MEATEATPYVSNIVRAPLEAPRSRSPLVFNDRALAERYPRGSIPMSTLIEAYLDGAVDLPDVDAFLDERQSLVQFSLTRHHIEFFVTKMLPEVAVHSKAQDARVAREHYDRGDDFFAAFLGERMTYTGAIFRDASDTLEQAQDNKHDVVCRKLMLQQDHTMLDIGCGWGGLVVHAAARFGARVTGITNSKNHAVYGAAAIEEAGVTGRARIECLDYRDIPRQGYDRIASLEMVEHVGVKNLPRFFRQVYDLLADDGLLLLQWTGFRRGAGEGLPIIGLRREDLVWNLFMNEYIFPGADASLPLGEMVKPMEQAGFQIHSVENTSIHYVVTLQRWHRNWQRNEKAIVAKYGVRWYRLWNLFLPWSVRIGTTGACHCFQAVAFKNTERFDRRVFFDRSSLSGS
jgi:cyclopropane fatty-acyl-phospholipid synthase-like methyltransferase